MKLKLIGSTGSVIIFSSNDLQIRNFNNSFSGIYICEYSDEYIEGAFTYVLDVFDVKPKLGLRDEWQRYKREKFDRINKNFKLSKLEPFVSIRNRLKLSFKIVTFFDDWGPCEPIGKGKGLRRRLAKCRLKPTSYKEYSNTSDSISRFFLLDKYDISCKSKTLHEILPALSNIVNIPDFEILEACNPRNDPIKDSGEKQIGFKYRDLKHICENDHLNLICPDIEIWSQIQWFKDNVLLNSTFRNNIADSDEEPHLTIDSYGTLYILHATKNEEAIYSCIVNGENMLLCDVRVVSKSRLLNREFIRYSIYLGFVLSLTLSCYCAGILVAWHRRSSFADPFYLNSQQTRQKVKYRASFN
ncbi:uncharacterized protein LOC116766306 isoform X2 [Danaus plexippus]|uniref:uncharacterized protein LOC116766306 isoform X2 n=1 Tax=Danaus plexippus TaxID=13037 RepID=UPI002AB274A0|nr:uncharacterized protein LOC116766306 isoform X2 [Danaus plexippus]